MNISEDFLYFIWKFRLYDAKQLASTDVGIEVLHPGTFNTDAGPDFNCAKIKVQGVLWVGQVEVHVKASDWILHNHHINEAYENVILHVVYESDRPVYRMDGTPLPVLELKGLFDLRLLKNYRQLLKSFNNFPCENQIGRLNQSYINTFLSKILIERLEEKAGEVGQILSRTKNDWNEVFYILLAKNFGFKINAIPFELLAFSTSFYILAKYKDRPLCIEALIFGQAGFLDQEFIDDYPCTLKAEYKFLCRKHQLKPINMSLWKFLRLRPQSFPTLRLAQFAATILKSGCRFSTILDITNVKELVELFNALPVNPYWKVHYHFNKMADRVSVQPGRSFINNIIINTVCQLLYVYGKHIGNQEYIDRAIAFLENISAEQNVIVDRYKACGLKIDTAYLSQALLQLNKNYCVKQKCLNCSLGVKIING